MFVFTSEEDFFMLKTGVFIGRMQPPHNSHISIILKSLTENTVTVVALGSANQYPTIKNPFTFYERHEMIKAAIPEELHHKLWIVPIEDHPSDVVWACNIQDCVKNIVGNNSPVTLYGHMKDDSSYYLKMFPEWKLCDTGYIDNLNATDIRRDMFEMNYIDQTKLHPNVASFISTWSSNKHPEQNVTNLEYFTREYNFVQTYRMSWAKAPYAPVFVTVDACVVCSGHILMVKRKAEPCAGAWALPGGFINQKERIIDACIRELREETRIKVPAPVLKGSVKRSEVFDDPERSLRGRTITHAFLIELPVGDLPKVRGSDDAEKAFWVPVAEVKANKSKIFEDHYQIICALTGM